MDAYNQVVGWSGWPILLHLTALVLGAYVIYCFVVHPESFKGEAVLLALIAVLLAVIIHRREDVSQKHMKKEGCCGGGRRY